MNRMEFNFVENHGLSLSAYKVINEDESHIEIIVSEGFVQTCKLVVPVMNFNKCHNDVQCYNEVEKCAMKYDRKNIVDESKEK